MSDYQSTPSLPNDDYIARLLPTLLPKSAHSCGPRPTRTANCSTTSSEGRVLGQHFRQPAEIAHLINIDYVGTDLKCATRRCHGRTRLASRAPRRSCLTALGRGRGAVATAPDRLLVQQHRRVGNAATGKSCPPTGGAAGG
jgi:hypothetical protein